MTLRRVLHCGVRHPPENDSVVAGGVPADNRTVIVVSLFSRLLFPKIISQVNLRVGCTIGFVDVSEANALLSFCLVSY